MAPKKSGLRNLPKKGVGAKKAEGVKGGRRKEPRISSNHSQVIRSR
jgi:hypothetical protein